MFFLVAGATFGYFDAVNDTSPGLQALGVSIQITLTKLDFEYQLDAVQTILSLSVINTVSLSVLIPISRLIVV